MPSLASALGAEIERRRRVGRVVCRVRRRTVPHPRVGPPAPAEAPSPVPRPGPRDPGVDPFDAALLELERVEPDPDPEGGWQPLHRPEARDRLIDCIGHEQAHGVETMPHAEAVRLADRFLELFDASALFYTLPETLRRSRAAFDDGVGAIDRENVGLLWFTSDGAGL